MEHVEHGGGLLNMLAELGGVALPHDHVRATEVIRLLFELEHQLAAAPSPGGAMEARLRGDRYYTPSLGQEVVQERFARLVLLCRDLTPLEMRVCRARVLGVAGHVQVDRLVPPDEAPARQLLHELPPSCITARGEEMVGTGRDGQGNVVPGRVLVRTKRALAPSWAQVAEQVGLAGPDPSRAARQVWQQAVVKVSERLTILAQCAHTQDGGAEKHAA